MISRPSITEVLDPFHSLERARDLLRRIIHSLSEAASVGMVPHSQIIDPYIQVLIKLRSTLRGEKNYNLSDLIRDQLASLGVELRDDPNGTTWIEGGTGPTLR